MGKKNEQPGRSFDNSVDRQRYIQECNQDGLEDFVDGLFQRMHERNTREQQPQQQPQSPGWLQRLQDATRHKTINVK